MYCVWRILLRVIQPDVMMGVFSTEISNKLSLDRIWKIERLFRLVGSDYLGWLVTYDSREWKDNYRMKIDIRMNFYFQKHFNTAFKYTQALKYVQMYSG